MKTGQERRKKKSICDLNNHLRPIFVDILPLIKEQNINYWVYGGIAIASIKKTFIRVNQDIDIFTLNNDFTEACRILESFCAREVNWKLKPSFIKATGRPKIELFIKENGQFKERLSLIPVYKSNNGVEFRFSDSRPFSMNILKLKKRNIENYQIFTPPKKFIKRLFLYHLDVLKNNKKISREDLQEKYKIDAEVILSKKEFKRYFN